MALVPLLVTILILCLIFGLIWWVLTMIPLPPPFLNIAQVVLGIIFVLVLLGLLLGGISIPVFTLK